MNRPIVRNASLNYSTVPILKTDELTIGSEAYERLEVINLRHYGTLYTRQTYVSRSATPSKLIGHYCLHITKGVGCAL
jgi:hypothetical protein